MVDLTGARQQILEQRQLLVGKREEASKAQTQLRDVLSKLPSITQRGLRGVGSFAGLKGRLRRGVLERTKKDISEKEALIKDYGTSLTKYEEETLRPFEAEVSKVDVEQKAFEKAKTLFRDKISPDFVTGPEYKYLKGFYQDKALTEKAFRSQVEQFETDFPDEKLKIDWERLRIKGVDSEAFGQTLSVKDYNLRIADFNKEIGGGSIVSDFVESSKGLSRTDKAKELGVLKDTSISTDLFPLVSAQEPIMTELPGGSLPGVKRLSVVSLPPKESTLLMQSIKERGPLTGSITYFGEATERKLKELQMFRARKDSSYEPYQEAATRKFAGFGVQAAPYFTPAGPALLVGTGFESLISPEGKRQREQLQSSLQEKGFGQISSKIIPYSIPALELGLGAYGVKGQVRNILQTRALKQTPTTVFVAEETSRRGLSEIDIISKTRIGKQDYYGVVKQVGIPGPKGYDVLMSKGYTIKPQLKVVRIPGTPFGRTIETLPIIEKVRRIPGTPFGKTTRAIKGEPFTSVGIGRELGQARYYGRDVFKRGTDLGRGAEATFAVKTGDKIIKGKTVGSFQKGEGEIVRYFGGKPTKLKITKEGKVSYKVKPTTFGYIQKGKPRVKEIEFNILPSGLDTQIPKQVQEQIVSQVAGLEVAAQAQAKKQAVSFFKQSKTISKGGIFPAVSVKQETIPAVKQKAVQDSALAFKQIPKQKMKPFLVSGVREKAESKTKQALKTPQGKKTIPLTKTEIIPRERLREKLFLRTPQKVKQKTKQRLKPISKIGSPGKPKLKLLKIFNFEEEMKKRKGLKKNGKELVTPFVKRYGKYIAISKPTTLKRALKKGKGRLLTTLGASLQIIGAKTGRKIKIAKETSVFRAGKKGKDPFTLVQKRGARLGRRQEVREIIQARGVKWIR